MGPGSVYHLTFRKRKYVAIHPRCVPPPPPDLLSNFNWVYRYEEHDLKNMTIHFDFLTILRMRWNTCNCWSMYLMNCEIIQCGSHALPIMVENMALRAWMGAGSVHHVTFRKRKYAALHPRCVLFSFVWNPTSDWCERHLTKRFWICSHMKWLVASGSPPSHTHPCTQIQCWQGIVLGSC